MRADFSRLFAANSPDDGLHLSELGLAIPAISGKVALARFCHQMLTAAAAYAPRLAVEKMQTRITLQLPLTYAKRVELWDEKNWDGMALKEMWWPMGPIILADPGRFSYLFGRRYEYYTCRLELFPEFEELDAQYHTWRLGPDDNEYERQVVIGVHV